MFEGGSFGYPEVPELRADSDWVTKSVELKVPAGATRLNIQPAMFYCTGVFEIADLTVTPHMVAPKQLGDAVLPAGATLDWDKTSVETVNAKRAQISLNGIWRFIPAAEAKRRRIPRSWGGDISRCRATGRFTRTSLPISWPRAAVRSGIFTMGRWSARAWYQRQAPIPAEWQGRAISLRLDRVCTDALVYVNGMLCGRVAWPWGSVDITRAVTPGKTADIRLLVAAIADPEKVGNFWQNALSSVSYTSAGLETRGLTGNVVLESRSSEARVTDVFVSTSTRKKDVSLDVELTGVKQAGRVQFVAEMLDETGAVEKTFTADAAVAGEGDADPDSLLALG